MEMAFFLCTHCSFRPGSRLPNEGKDVARGGDPVSGRCIRSATIANGVAEEWTSSHSGHEVDVCSERKTGGGATPRRANTSG